MKRAKACLLVLCLAICICMPGSLAVAEASDDEQAVFTAPLLDRWVRDTLGKQPNDLIMVCELDPITEIRFAGAIPIGGQTEVGPNEFPMGGVMVFHEDGSQERLMGWDFGNLNDFAQFRNLKKLTIAGQQLTDISGIANLGLTELNLTYNHVSDISPLAGMRSLERLVLAQNPVEDLSPLASLVSLQTLDISYTNVADLSPLIGLSDLFMLGIDYCIDLHDIATLKVLPSLNVLIMRGIDADLSFLSDCPVLENLCLTAISDADLRYVESIQNLQALDLRYCDPERISSLSLPGLHSLSLVDCTFNSLEMLRGCLSLKDLFVLRLPLTTADLPENLANLHSVTFQGCNGMSDITPLAALPNLENVVLPEASRRSYERIQKQVAWMPGFDGQVYQVYDLALEERMRRQSPNPWPRPCESALSPPVYVPLAEAQAYNRQIIPDVLFNVPTTLPDASNAAIPYWTGMTAENKGGTDRRFLAARYWFEDEVKFLAENGFNFYRALYDFSFISEQGNPLSVNLRALEEIDQLIAWGMQYGVHIQISLNGLPNCYGLPDEGQILEMGGTRFIDDDAQQALLKQIWSLLARRYADIPNRYLDFELMAEPTYRGALPWEKANKRYYAAMVDIMDSIWAAEGNKPKQDRRVLMLMTLEAFNDPISKAVAKLIREEGCVVTQHTGVPHWIAGGGAKKIGQDEYRTQPFLPEMGDVTWPILFLPQVIRPTGKHDPLTLRSETAFPAGTVVTLYVFYDGGGTLAFHADGQRLLRIKGPKAWSAEGAACYAVTLNKAAQDITLHKSNDGEIWMALLTVEVPGQDIVRLVPHSIYRNNTGYADMPTITIQGDGSVISSQVYDGEAIYNAEIRPFMEKVQEAGGGYMITEFGTGGATPLTLVSAMTEDTFGVLQSHRIPWSADCIWDVLQCSIRPGTTLKQYGDTPWFYDAAYIDMLKKYAAGADQ